MNARILWGGILVLIALAAAGLPAEAATLHVELTFNAPMLSDEGDGTMLVEAAGCVTFNEPGLPLLPARSAVVLLPPGEAVTAIRVIAMDEHLLDGSYQVAWAQQPRPISASGAPTAIAPNPVIYGSDEIYPPEPARLVTEQIGWGHRLAFLRVYPVAYRPVSGELVWYERVAIEVETALPAGASAREIPRLRRTDRVRDRLADLVVNPEELSRYDLAGVAPHDSRIDPDTYPYVIVTKAVLADAFQPLVDFQSSRGLRACVMTVEQITAEYPGTVDIQQSIRNFIIDAYEHWGTEYVLLGGDHDVVEERDLYVNAGGTVDNFPGDCYYEALDGTWNNDGDSRWGEPGEEDLIGEIAVGRASVNNATEIARWMHKNMMYTEQPVVSQIQRGLFIGEQLDSSTWGGDSVEEIRTGSSTCGYTTTGYPSNYTRTTLYERTTSWDKYDLIDLMNSGYPTTHHLGHSNTTICMKLVNSDVQHFTNDGVNATYMFNYSQGCYAGDFDNSSTDCIVEMMVNDDNASAAFIANSRYGWYMPGSVCGPSQHFERYFVDACYDENTTTIGRMNVDSKVDCIWMLDEYMRWCHYEICIFGDPAMPQWRSMQGTLALSHAGAYLIGQGDYEVAVTAGGWPVSAATVTIYSEEGEIWASGSTNAQGVVVLDPGPQAPMTLHVKAIKADYLPVVDEIDVVPASGPYLVIAQHTFIDGSGDGRVDAGEAVELALCLRNVGTQTATGVSATIATADEYVQIDVATQSWPNLGPGVQQWGNGAFEFHVAPDCPDAHPVVVAVTISGNGRPVWTGEIGFVVHAPDISIVSLLIDDTVGGDGDLHIEAGETASVTLALSNGGSGMLSDIIGRLTCAHPLVTITSATGTHAGLGEGATGVLAPPFVVQVDAGFTSSGASFSLLLNGGNSYSHIFDVPLPCGGFYETMEAGAGDWTHHVVSGGSFVDEWHISTERNHTPAGSRSWKCGSSGTGSYANLLDAGLETAPVTIGSEGSALLFWHWMDAEVSGAHAGRAYDGGLIEMAVDGGPFVQITPDGGYPYTIRTGGSPGPFATDTPVFSGTHEWRQERFDLGTTTGTVVFRFRFGSDGADAREGWHVDDVVVNVPNPFSGTEEPVVKVSRLQLLPSRPNPSTGSSRLEFILPEGGRARVEVFDASGRWVSTVTDGDLPAGQHRADWSGRDSHDRPVTSGLYYFRLSTDHEAVQRTAIVVQ